MYTLSQNYRTFDRQEWSDFLTNHPFGNIFHSPEMVDLYNASLNREPIVIACFNELKEFEGILVAEIQREYKGIAGDLTARAIVMGGPLVNGQNPEIAMLLIEEFNRVCRGKVVFSQFRNLWSTDDLKAVFLKCNYIFEQHLNFLFNLKSGADVLWGNIHPTRRKQINRGLKREVTPLILDKLTSEEFDTCIEILNQVYKEAKLPCPTKQYFQNAFKILSDPGYLRIAVVKFEQQIVGFRFFLSYANTLYDWYAGSLSTHYDKYPNDILPWEAIKWGAENNYRIFDFGGAGKPDVPYGVRDYKMKFGGELVNFGRYEKVHKPIIYQFAKIGFKIWKILKFK